MEQCTISHVRSLLTPIQMLQAIEEHKVILGMFDDEGFLLTDDAGYFDEDGYLHVIDRLDNYFKH